MIFNAGNRAFKIPQYSKNSTTRGNPACYFKISQWKPSLKSPMISIHQISLILCTSAIRQSTHTPALTDRRGHCHSCEAVSLWRSNSNQSLPVQHRARHFTPIYTVRVSAIYQPECQYKKNFSSCSKFLLAGVKKNKIKIKKV